MSWALVVIAGVCETVFAVTLKMSHGFTRVVPTVLFCVFALLSFGMLNIALRTLPVGSAYAVWTGIGAAGTAAVGMIFLGEIVATLKIVSIVLIIAGVVGLQLSGNH
jgi:quaternary ammonium compound-resistance protein SugE